MFISADQILAHLIGDYILQSDWMANEKTKRSVAAAAHAVTYALPFLFFRPSIAAFAFVVVTHFVIDRWRLARFVVWAKNFIAPRRGLCALPKEGQSASCDGRCPQRRNLPWSECTVTGYPPDRPVWLTVWLLIIADNTLHLICNGLALRWL